MVDEEIESDEVGPAQFSWVTVCSILMAWVYGMFMVSGTAFKTFSETLDSHVLWKAERKAFRERASLEIEALIREVSEVKV